MRPSWHWAAVAVLALITLPVELFEPATGLDGSWKASLALAWTEGLRFGEDLDFTYGPLGFLYDPGAFYPSTARLGALVMSLVAVAYLAMLYRTQRRNLGVPLALPVAFAISTAVWLVEAPPFEPMLFAACFWALRPEAEPERAVWVAAAAGSAAAILLLMKISVGIALVGLTVVLVLGSEDRRRCLLAFAVTLALTMLVAWLMLGQGLANLIPFLSHSSEIVSGYSSTMSLTAPQATKWINLAGIIVAALFVVCVSRTTREWETRGRVAAVALALAFLFPILKEGFVRADPGHQAIFFVTTLAAFPFIGWSRRDRLLQLVTLSLCLLVVSAAVSLSVRRDFDPLGGLEATVEGVRDLAGSGIGERAAEARARLRKEYALSPSVLAAVRGRRTHIEPEESGVAWAYPEIVWSPLPVFQEYSAYTPALDELNADALRSVRAPERILRRATTAIDGRLAIFDAPSTQLELLCGYRTSVATSAWQVIEPTGRRCSDEHPSGEVKALVGQDVPVPAPDPDELVIARMEGIGLSLGDRVRSTAYKLGPRYMVVNGEARHRLVPRNAGGPLILRSGLRADHPQGFAIAPQAATFRIEPGEGLDPDNALTVAFTRVVVR